MKIFIPETSLEVWHVIKDKLPADKMLRLVKYGHLSKEMLDDCQKMDTREISAKAKERLDLEEYGPIIRFTPTVDIQADWTVSNEPVDIDPDLLARLFLPDSYVDMEGIDSSIEFGMPTITQSFPAVLAKIDHTLKQQTSIEIREFAHCIDDARTGDNWRMDDPLGWMYNSPRLKDCEISIDRRNYEPTETALEVLKERLSGKTKMTVLTILAMLAEARGSSIRIDLTEFAGRVHGIHSIDSTKEAKQAREQVKNDIEFASKPKIRSTRGGRYRITTSSKTVKAIEISSDDMLFRITSRIVRPEDTSDCLAMIIEPAGIMKEYAGQRHILTDYGSMPALLDVKYPNRPAGMIAQSIGMTLNQLWRERASRSDTGDNGDNHRAIAKFDTFTRRELLLHIFAFKCELNIDQFLSTKDAKRIVDYWNKAIKDLQRLRVVGHYKESGELDLSGRNWRDKWLDQRLSIRPGAEGNLDAVDIAKQKTKRDQAIKRSRRRSAKKAESIDENGNPEQ
jgi:hypothetical protein